MLDVDTSLKEGAQNLTNQHSVSVILKVDLQIIKVHPGLL